MFNSNHVQLRDSLCCNGMLESDEEQMFRDITCNANNKWYFSVHCFMNSLSSSWCWNIDYWCVSSCFLSCLLMEDSRMNKHTTRQIACYTSTTLLNTGSPRCVWPPLPGDTPPTMFVPYSIACLLWKVPCLPVKPWQITLVWLPILRLPLVDV